MNESAKDKKIRYILIIIFVLLTISALFFRSNKQILIPKDDGKIKIAVINEAKQLLNNNPVIALYHEQNKEHILTIYEIELNNKYHFKAKQSITLKKKPKKIANDLEENGVWVKLDKEWTYFNEHLEMSNENNKENKLPITSTFSFQINKIENEYELAINSNHYGNKSIALPDKTVPDDIYSLTENGDLWLLVYGKEISIAIAK